MKLELPLPITVVIPAHNRAATVGRAVTSALAQRPSPPAEVVVIDDGSADRTADMARDAGAQVVRHPVNRGAGAARNLGVSNATQPWIAFLDSDDEWLPHHLARLWPLREPHVLLASAALSLTSHAEQRHLGPPEPRGRMLRSPLDVATSSIVVTSTVLARRNTIKEAGGFGEAIEPKPQVEDFDLWLRLLERGTGYVSSEVSVLYHEQGGAGPIAGPGLQLARRRVLESYTDRSWFRPELLDAWGGIMAWDAARSAQRSGDHRGAIRNLAHIPRHGAATKAVLGELGVRFRARRRSLRISPAGTPTLAIVDPALASGPQPEGFVVVVPEGATKLARYAALARRPAAAAVVNRRTERVVARALGMRAVAPSALPPRAD